MKKYYYLEIPVIEEKLFRFEVNGSKIIGNPCEKIRHRNTEHGYSPERIFLSLHNSTEEAMMEEFYGLLKSRFIYEFKCILKKYRDLKRMKQKLDAVNTRIKDDETKTKR